MGIKGDVAMRRKNGALSLEAKSVSVKGAFFQAKAFKAGVSVYVSIQNILPHCICWDSQVGHLKLEDFIEKTIRQRMFYLHTNC